jgi:hypothetical protein
MERQEIVFRNANGEPVALLSLINREKFDAATWLEKVIKEWGQLYVGIEKAK